MVERIPDLFCSSRGRRVSLLCCVGNRWLSVHGFVSMAEIDRHRLTVEIFMRVNMIALYAILEPETVLDVPIRST